MQLCVSDASWCSLTHHSHHLPLPVAKTSDAPDRRIIVWLHSLTHSQARSLCLALARSPRRMTRDNPFILRIHGHPEPLAL